MEPLREALFDDACSELESLGQVDGIFDSPLTLPGKTVEVEGVEMEPEERSMKGWSQVRRKISQEEKDAAADTRGWEAFKSSYPFLAHYWRQGEKWRRKAELYNVRGLERFEAARRKELELEEMAPVKREVEKK